VNSLLLIARLLLAAVFGVAGVAKLLDQAGSRKSLAGFGVPAVVTPAAALLLPVVELACAVALLWGSWARWGATGALALLLLFVVAIAVNMMRGRQPDCHCFGQLHSSPAGWATLTRNLVLSAIAGLIVWQQSYVVSGFLSAEGLPKAVSRTSYVESSLSWSQPGVVSLGVLVVGQILSVLFMLLVFYQLLRQNGRTLQRLDAIEAKLGIKAQVPQAAGLPVNSAAPAFELPRLDGASVTLDALREGGKPILLLFSEPGCSACDTILPDVGRWQREHSDRLTIVPISRGGADANRAKATPHGVQHVLVQRDREVAQKYGVENTPSAVLVTDGLIASPLAVGPDAIRALVTDATLPPPLKRGDRVPSLQLRDLNGGTVDLATLNGRRTLLLFWNPSCGFCQGMLDEVKAWERDRSGEAPELVVISAGSPKANREQGFRSRVLLDSRFSAGARFGAGGTPSAVIVDEEGRLASEVGVGAPAVLALAGLVPLRA
jgi:peroxiredoxin